MPKCEHSRAENPGLAVPWERLVGSIVILWSAGGLASTGVQLCLDWLAHTAASTRVGGTVSNVASPGVSELEIMIILNSIRLVTMSIANIILLMAGVCIWLHRNVWSRRLIGLWAAATIVIALALTLPVNLLVERTSVRRDDGQAALERTVSTMRAMWRFRGLVVDLAWALLAIVWLVQGRAAPGAQKDASQ